MRKHAWLLALLLLGATCGFQGADDFSGARLGSGNAPLSDQGSVTLCLDGVLVGVPDSDPAGLCMPTNAGPEPTCASDADCKSRERCVCGHCRVQFCDGPGQCGESRDCNFRRSVCGVVCSDQIACPGDDDICDRGFCTVRCMTDTDCQTGESCAASTHRCTVTACRLPGDCVTGAQTCEIQRNPGDLREPALTEGNPLTLFVEIRPSDTTGQILRGETRDNGHTWTLDPKPLLVPSAAERRLGAPSGLRIQGGWLLYFDQPDGIGLAISRDDGRTFERDSAPVLRPDGAPSWEAGAVHSPGVTVLADKTVLLFYEGGDGAGIGLATSIDGRTFTKLSAPVLRAADIEDPTLWREIHWLGEPATRAAIDPTGREVVSLWFSARGVETAATVQSGMLVPPMASYSIGYAASVDGGHTFRPYPFNPVLDRAEQFLQHDQEWAPTAAPLGDGFLLLYQGADFRGARTNLGLAANPG